jgi:hypothetical protein
MEAGAARQIAGDWRGHGWVKAHRRRKRLWPRSRNSRHLQHNRKESVQLIDMFAAMSWIADQGSTAKIDHEIEMLQWQLADEDGNLVRNFHDIHGALAAPDG